MTYLDTAHKKTCSGCGACQSICPKGCIGMIEDSEGFLYPQIDGVKCIKCNRCRILCSTLNRNTSTIRERQDVYAAYIPDDELRYKSSSGGVFSQLAQYTLGKGGVVFGAGFDKDFNVIHKGVKNISELDELRGSKYVQSLIGNTYKEAESYLKQNRTVLFTGTPCQIDGLYAYLGKDYESLLTCDLICGGVPSPKVYRLYLQKLRNNYNSGIKSLNHRSKEIGWGKGFYFRITFKNGKVYGNDSENDPYLKSFLTKLISRPSCYACKYANANRCGDITLADYWKVDRFHPEMDDKKGTSLIIVNSEKGGNVLQLCSDRLNIKVSKFDYAVVGNPCLLEPTSPRDDREQFFIELNKKDYIKVEKKYMDFSSKIMRFLRRPVYHTKRLSKKIFSCPDRGVL